jgi:hypothetical protein
MQNTITQWTSKVEKDAYGDLFFVIPEEVRMQLGWKPGDTLVWTILENNSVTLHKKDQ